MEWWLPGGSGREYEVFFFNVWKVIILRKKRVSSRYLLYNTVLVVNNKALCTQMFDETVALMSSVMFSHHRSKTKTPRETFGG